MYFKIVALTLWQRYIDTSVYISLRSTLLMFRYLYAKNCDSKQSQVFIIGSEYLLGEEYFDIIPWSPQEILSYQFKIESVCFIKSMWTILVLRQEITTVIIRIQTFHKNKSIHSKCILFSLLQKDIESYFIL